MRQSRAVIDASGPGFALTISGVPVFACDECRTSLHLHETGPGVNDIIAAVMDALDKLGANSLGTPMHVPNQCRKCKTTLPREIDKSRAHFAMSSPMGPGGAIIGIQYYGNALTCPKCGQKHPHLSPVVYHNITDSIYKASAIYMRY